MRRGALSVSRFAGLPNISKIGVGAYRLGFSSPLHEASLATALTSGLNLIDTSANYEDGDSERLIGQTFSTFSNRVAPHLLNQQLPNRKSQPLRLPSRNDVVIMSKFGYIQGENMELLKKGFIKTPEVVQFAPECYHCIHPDFMRDQLTRSLKRLDTDRIDVYLLHNPEYYLVSNLPLFEEGASTGPDSGAPAVRVQDRTQVKEHQKKLLDRFSATFEALEKEVQSGRIKSYGISSNTFAYDESHPHFVPYEPLLDLATEAAKRAAGTSRAPAFSTVQFPANILEQTGLSGIGDWARQKGINAVVNRPLNAFTADGAYRLASYGPCNTYRETLRQTMIQFESAQQRNDPTSVHNLVRDLDEAKDKFHSIFHFEDELIGKIVPMFRQKLSTQFPNSGELPLKTVQRFLDELEMMVRFYCAQRTEEFVESLNIGYKRSDLVPLQNFSLKFLVDNPNVTSVLTG